MTSQTLTLLIIYFGLTTTLGGLLMSWRFSALNREAMTGAFMGFGAGLLGIGVPGLLGLWWLMPRKAYGLQDDSDYSEYQRVGFHIERNAVWGMGAFGLMWILLAILASNTEPSRFVVVVAGGMYEGMLIFLVAAGLSIIFGLMDVLNLSQGALFMIGAYTATLIFREVRGTLGLYPAFLLGLVAAFLLGGIIGVLMERFLIRPTYSRPIFQIVLTFGVGLAMTEFIISLYGNDGIPRPDLTLADGSDSLLTGLISGTRIQAYWVFMIVMGGVMMVGVQHLLQNTRLGIIIRAGVQDSDMVEALGVNVRLIFTLVFGLGAAIAALGGAVASGFLSPNPAMGEVFLLQAIAVVIIGGLGSYSGTAVASIVLGIAGAVMSHFAFVNLNSDALGSTAVLIMLLVVLFMRPTGLFGRAH